MSKDIFTGDTSNITGEACAWIAQLETGKLTTADQDAFREWISRSPRHAAEIKFQAQLSKQLNVLTGMSQSINEAAAQQRAAVSRKRPLPAFSLVTLGLVSFAVSLVVALTIVFWPAEPSVENLIYTTAIGEFRQIELPDGSIVKLNTDSQIEVNFDKNNRKVRLLSGEAYFQVSHNAKRPFWVYAADQYVRVVGTAFVVSLYDQQFDLVVTEGRVELAKNPSPMDSPIQMAVGTNMEEIVERTPIALTAGQSIRILQNSAPTEIQPITEREQQRLLSWQEGLHDFSNTPLEEVVRELSRFSTTKIEIMDPELKDLKFGGVFRIGDTQLLFEALETAYGVQVSYSEDDSVRLSLRR